MPNKPLANALSRIVLFSLLPVSSTLHAGTRVLETEATPRTKVESSFRNAVQQLESSQGAYSMALAEQLLSLGLALQGQGKHDEAVATFKRGVHLARINNGLYSAEQIPLLQGEIASQVALGKYAEADERQHYLYRVQVRALDQGASRAEAFMQQARWQHNAYRLGLDGLGFTRLTSMWDLNYLAYNDIAEREGDTSTSLLPPLYGMLQAQYLIAGYQGEGPSASGYGGGETFADQQDQNRFHSYRAKSYKQGRAVILAIYQIRQHEHGSPGPETAETLTMLGDWQLWNGEKDAALATYQNAIAELVERDDAQVEIDRLFGEPVALPDVDGVRHLPAPVAAEAANVVLEFDVSETGRVENLERLDDNEEINSMANKLMRSLRKTRFRPRFEMAEPVHAEAVTRAYDIK